LKVWVLVDHLAILHIVDSAEGVVVPGGDCGCSLAAINHAYFSKEVPLCQQPDSHVLLAMLILDIHHAVALGQEEHLLRRLILTDDFLLWRCKTCSQLRNDRGQEFYILVLPDLVTDVLLGGHKLHSCVDPLVLNKFFLS
jgi:hypothetical protein